MKRKQIFLFLFFLSGGCGLVYEVVWTRLFITVIGNTVFSVSAILTVFMAGLALGSRIAGRYLDHRPIRLIRSYALLEGGVGIYNVLLPLLIRAADPLFGALYARASESFLILAFARLVIVFLILIVPATLMGATLPILIRFFVENVAAAGSEAGRVYTANTLGAAVGAATAGFMLVPMIGVTASLISAAVVNLAIAGLAFQLSRTGDAESMRESEKTPAIGPRIVLIAMLTSGMAALMNEVAWTRVLGLVVGPTTYAFTLMLVSMIGGLGLGAALGSHLVRRREISLAAFSWIEIGIGVTSLALIPAFGRLPVWIGQLVTRYVESFATIEVAEFLIFFSLMLVPTTLLGMTFPVASRLFAKSNSLLGTEVSAVYSFNTIGGIAGSLAAGFLLIPHFGSQSTLVIASLLSLGTAVMLQMRPLTAVVALLVAGSAFVLPRWDPELMSSGAYKYAPYFSERVDMESVLKSGELLYFKEGATTTVSVKKFRGRISLAIDGKVDATDSGDMTTQAMLGHLPLLLSRQPKNVAVIGFGSGVTAGAVLQHPIESLDVVEISPEVVAASDLFKHVNHKALEDPRTRLIIGDGRNHLRYVKKQYDVVISEPSNPWMAGMALLFSREFFSEVLSKLTPKGIHCQWFHSYNMSTEDLKTVIATFRSVFPHAQLWALNENDFLLLGSANRIDIDEAVVSANFHHIAADLGAVRIQDLYSVLSLYMLEDEDLDRFADGAQLNTDDHPVLEFHAPQYIHANTTAANYAGLLAIQQRVEPSPFLKRVLATATSDNHRRKGDMYLAAESFKPANAEYRIAIEANADDAPAWRGLLDSARGDVDRDELKTFIENMLARHSVPVVQLAASDFYTQANDHKNAAVPLVALLDKDPKNLVALEKLADSYDFLGDLQLPAIIERLRAIDPENPNALLHLANVRFYQGLPDEAISLASRVLEREPGNTRAQNLIAIAYGQTFQPDKAEAEFQKTIKESPADWVTFNNFGLFLVERGRFADALSKFAEAIDINPENVQGYVGMGEAYRQSGDMKRAEPWYQRALRLDPNQPVAKLYVK